jgi:hypothetical protein
MVARFHAHHVIFMLRMTVILLQTYLATLAVELGPNGDDTLIIGSAFERANFIEAPTDFDLAILGGTGRYKGATGEVFHSGPRVTTAWNVYVAEVAVPKFKRF